MRIPVFRIFYSTTFSILVLLLLVLLLVSPGDGIYQALHSGRLGQVLTIGGVYILTFLFALLIYSTRLYTIRSHLSSIPRTWIPIKKGDVTASVRRMIVKGLQRSASIAYEAYPRDLQQDRQVPRTLDTATRPTTATTQPSGPPQPIWGTIAHPGWSAPSSPDLPNLHFLPVILELPHLIEAKAVSLAPTDPLHVPSSDLSALPLGQQSPLPDAVAVGLLLRPATMGLRDYLSHLSSLSLIQPPTLGPLFLSHYERARFSDQPLTEQDFRALLNIFADLLRGMKELDPAIVAELHAEEDYTSDSDSSSGSSIEAKSLSSTNTVEHTPFHTPMPHHSDFPDLGVRRAMSGTSLAGSEGTVRTAPSRARTHRNSAARSRATSSGKRSRAASNGAGSGNSRRHRDLGLQMTSSNSVEGNLRRTTTRQSSASSARSGGSVIRLAERSGPLDLPYVISIAGVSGEGDEEVEI